MEKKMPGSDKSTAKFVRSMRDAPPLDYVMKIDPFSSISKLLEKSVADKYESSEFEAEGHKWKLILYPNGNKKCDEDGYISLYLAMPDAKKLALGSEVNVMLKFFVLDQIKANYITFEEGRLASFHALKNERGIARFLPLTLLNDSSNGFLVDDCCTFGVEVTVIESKGKGEKLTLVNQPDYPTFSWSVDKFSTFKGASLFSEEFNDGGFKWKLMFYPSGHHTVKGKYCSLYLNLLDSSDLCPGWKVFVEFKLFMKDQIYGKHVEMKAKCWFCASTTQWGFPTFVSLSDLNNQWKGFIVKDIVVVEAQINLISVVSCFA